MDKNLKANKITVKSFRGINNEISLQLGNITVLKGENGTGKSSFVNSIEYLFSKDLAFLKNKTINTTRSAVNRNANLDDVKIELKFKSKRFVKFEHSKRENTPIFNDILKNTYVKNASFILNRKKLLTFIDGTQGKRYNAIMELCGMEKINKIESALSASQSSLTKEFDKTLEQYNNKLTELSNLLTGKPNSDFDNCILNLNNRLKSNGKDTIDKNTDIDEFISNLNLSEYNIIQNKIDSFNQVYDRIDIASFDYKLSNILDEYESIASDNLKTSQSLLKTLISSQNYIKLTNSDTCPVCENEIDSSEILAQISDKIDVINQNDSNFTSWKRNISLLISDLDFQIENCKNLNSIISELNELIDDKLPNFEYGNLINLKKDLTEFLEFKKVASDFKDIKFAPMVGEINSIKNLLVDYEYSQNIDDLADIYKILFNIKELNQIQSEINVLEKQRNIAIQTFNIFTKSKKKFIKDMISEIREDIKKYYEYIHGDDEINSPDIQLTGSKLVDVYLNSFGDVVDSRSYASEGHLDTLGICIFLAFNKKFSPLPLIVLDDVFTTVDLPHKERIGRLIVDVLTDYQFIITTHSSLWSEQLKRLCADAHRDFKLYEIIDWSLEEGPVFTTTPNETEEKIYRYLSNEYQDFQAAGNAARRYLEYVLTQICVTNNVKVPINDKYDVGTLFDEAKNFTEVVVEGTSLEPYYAHVWGEINKTRHIANILSHHNEESDLLPKSDIEKFCEDVINLKQAYTCYCGQKSFLKLDSDSKKLICFKKNCRASIDMNSFADIDFGFEKEEIES